jgi:hypothetical protein
MSLLVIKSPFISNMKLFFLITAEFIPLFDKDNTNRILLLKYYF